MSKRDGQIAPIRGPEEFAAAFEVSRQIDRPACRLRGPAAAMAEDHQSGRPQHAGCGLAPPFRRFGPAAALAPPAPRTWVDLGSGAGFPGLVVAIMLAGGACHLPAVAAPPTPSPSPQGAEGEPRRSDQSNLRVTLIESDARKAPSCARSCARPKSRRAWLWISCRQRIEAAATQAKFGRAGSGHGAGIGIARQAVGAWRRRYSRPHGRAVLEGPRRRNGSRTAAKNRGISTLNWSPAVTDAGGPLSSSATSSQAQSRRIDPVSRATSASVSASLPSPTKRAASARPPPPSTSAPRSPRSARGCSSSISTRRATPRPASALPRMPGPSPASTC